MSEQQIGQSVTLMSRRNRRVWLAKRRKIMGATDAVAVLGYSKFRTPLDVWMEKAKRIKPADLSGKYVVERGHALEGLIIAEWSRRNEAQLVEVPPLVGHPEYPFLAASLDAVGEIDGRQTICEAKAVTWRAKDDWWNESLGAPDQYVVQTLIQLAVTGLDEAHLCADVAGEYTQLTIERDREFEAWALPALADWWKRHVVGGEEPDIDPVRDYPSLRRLWVPDPGVTIDADPLLMSDIRAYRHAAFELKDRKATADELKGRIRIAMREASAITDPDTGRRLVSVSKNGALRVAEHREETEK